MPLTNATKPYRAMKPSAVRPHSGTTFHRVRIAAAIRRATPVTTARTVDVGCPSMAIPWVSPPGSQAVPAAIASKTPSVATARVNQLRYRHRAALAPP